VEVCWEAVTEGASCRRYFGRAFELTSRASEASGESKKSFVCNGCELHTRATGCLRLRGPSCTVASAPTRSQVRVDLKCKPQVAYMYHSTIYILVYQGIRQHYMTRQACRWHCCK